jgi:hypothetical protein
MKSLSLAVAASITLAVPAIAGGPWISVELPANPYGRVSRGAYVVVHTYLHETPAPFLVTGTAEGLVGGQRRSMPLTITSTGQGGSMAISRSWPSEGVWVLKLGVDGAELGAAVGVGANGEVAFVRVPLTRGGATRNVARAEVETLLRALEAGQLAPALQAAGWSHPEHRRQALAGVALMSGLAGAGLVQLLRGLRKQRD